MSRYTEVQIDGQFIRKDSDEYREWAAKCQTGPTVFGDLPDFVSPIDGSVVHGRAGLREHCIKHNVVPTADLAGLPVKLVNPEYKPDRAAIREEIRRQLYK